MRCLHENIWCASWNVWLRVKVILKIISYPKDEVSCQRECVIYCVNRNRRKRHSLISTNEIYEKLKCGIFKLIWDIFENRPPTMSILLRWIEIDMTCLYLSFLSMNICIFLKEFEPSERPHIGSVSKHGSPFVLCHEDVLAFSVIVAPLCNKVAPPNNTYPTLQ